MRRNFLTTFLFCPITTPIMLFNLATSRLLCSYMDDIFRAFESCDAEKSAAAIPPGTAPRRKALHLGRTQIFPERRPYCRLEVPDHTAWSQSIEKMLPHKELELVLGRLSHAAFVIPYARYFIGRLYKACKRSKQIGKVRLTRSQLDDQYRRPQFDNQCGKSRWR
jgi:hypothetical protein